MTKVISIHISLPEVWFHMKKLARTRNRGKLMAVPEFCWYIFSLRRNYTVVLESEDQKVGRWYDFNGT